MNTYFFSPPTLRKLFFIFLSASTLSHAGDFDNIDFDFDDFGDAASHMDLHVTRQALPEDVVDVLVELGVVNFFQLDLFKRTHQLNKRSLLDLPLFLPMLCKQKGKWAVGSHLFFNQMTRRVFIKNETGLPSYINILDDNLIAELRDSLDKVIDDFTNFNLDPANVLPLFANMTTQERRIGFMMHGERVTDNWMFRIKAPLYYLEYNWYLRPDEQAAVEAVFGALPDEQAEQFQQNHFISDEVAFGDTRLELCKLMYDKNCTQIFFGGHVTLPTAFRIFGDIKGSEFNKPKQRPTFSWQELFDLSVDLTDDATITEEITNKLVEFSLGALDNINAHILDAKPGNGGHVGLALFAEFHNFLSKYVNRPWAEKFLLKSYVCLEYLLPKKECRFFIEQPDPNKFSIENFDPSDPAKAPANLALLDKEFVDKFYPFFFDARVHPGVIIHWASKACYEGERIGFNLGSDTWIRTSESLKNIEVDIPDLQPLAVNRAERPLAYQGRLVGSIHCRIDSKKNRVWNLSLSVDKVYASSGIGKDFTVTLNLEAHF